ncbi:hypothetical protein ACK8OR_05225 [Jannaschia sp. KMU-145]|uniref:hypothetical protein n=1 Tax=Jannaschia halovivens TaxID=3388667 RepID=UPI00396B1B47
MIRTAFALTVALTTPAVAQDAPAPLRDDATLVWAMLPALDGVDRDDDGRFTQAEIGGTVMPLGVDADGDGMFDLPEITQALFAIWDRDDNGYLDTAELDAMTGLAAAGVYPLPE